jgi:hypothetical protein
MLIDARMIIRRLLLCFGELAVFALACVGVVTLTMIAVGNKGPVFYGLAAIGVVLVSWVTTELWP